MEKEEINIGGSSFWILLTLVAISSLIYLLIWSFHNNSVKGIAISTIFAIMILASAMFSRFKVFDFSSWGDNALSFTLGFFIWIGLGSLFSTQSVLSVSQNQLFSTISSELPQLVEFVVNVFLIPIAEELFWIIGLPFVLITLMVNVGKKISFFNNGIFQMAVIIIVGASTFAYFHVGNVAFISFIVAAMIFRTIMLVLVYGEHKYDIFKKINVVAGFSVGAHIANNLSEFGVGKAFVLLQSNFYPIGIMIYVLLGVLFLSGIERLISLFMGKKSVTASAFNGGGK